MALPRHFGSACELEGVGPDVPASDDPGPGFRWILLQRHGRRPIAMLGRALLQANNRCAGLSHWSEISIYETVSRRFAASWSHTGVAVTGPGWCDARLCDSPEAVSDMLYSHDPVAGLSFHHVARWDATAGRADIGGCFDAVSHEATVAQHFRGAWAGLLAAMFGLPAAHRAIR